MWFSDAHQVSNLLYKNYRIIFLKKDQVWLKSDPGGRNVNPLQYFFQENTMDRRARCAIVHGASQSQTQLKCLSTHTSKIWNINKWAAAASAKSLQSCSTLCDPIDDSPPGSPIPGILQARTLEWVVSSFSNAWKWKAKVKSLSRVRLSATPWTAAHQAPPSVGFSRQEYWSGLPLPSPNKWADTVNLWWYLMPFQIS